MRPSQSLLEPYNQHPEAQHLGHGTLPGGDFAGPLIHGDKATCGQVGIRPAGADSGGHLQQLRALSGEGREVCTVLQESPKFWVLQFRGAKQLGARLAGIADGRSCALSGVNEAMFRE